MSEAANRPDPAPAPAEPPPALQARRLIRRGLTASLATVGDDGAPSVSLVAYATRPDGSPLFLFSGLSPHTRNLARDPRFALLVAEPPKESGDPMDSARVIVSGRIARSDAPLDRARFLRRHASAGLYAGLSDFKIHAGEVTDVHFVGGFARARSLAVRDVLIEVAGTEALAEAEEGIVAHMNGDHAEAIALYATRLLGRPAGAWTMTGLDPEGADLRAENRTARLEFPRHIATAGEARDVLVVLAKQARAA